MIEIDTTEVKVVTDIVMMIGIGMIEIDIEVIAEVVVIDIHEETTTKVITEETTVMTAEIVDLIAETMTEAIETIDLHQEID